MTSNLQMSRNALMLLGIVLSLMGLVVLFSPAAAGGAVVWVVAAVMVLAGVGLFIQGLRAGRRDGGLVSLVLGAVIAVLGVLVWLNPAIGSGFLTLLLMAFFVANGLWKVSTAWHFRGTRGWAWLLLSGFVSLLFVYLLWKEWPLSGAWAIGVLVGVDLLFTGISMVLLSLALRRVRQSGYVDTINL